LVSRRRELDVAQRAMAETKVLTFTGPGGVGKTRLAIELAYRTHARYPDGAWLVELAELGIGAGPEDLESAIVSALGVTDQSASHPRETLLAFLPTRRLLIVLDNCEHVLPALRTVLPALLRSARQLRVIATSREPLGVEGEAVRPVGPLSVPELATPVGELIAEGAVSLLLERARAVDPEFELTDDNAPAVVELCRLLDGMPLAIELAAVKLRVLTVEQVVQRFGHQLTALTAPAGSETPRHHSLRAMVEWSYELCSPRARLLWRRLSVFPGSFDLELAEDVCAFGDLTRDEVVGTIESLVAQSILLTDRGKGTMRYRMLAPVREFAAELAATANETGELATTLRDAMLQRAQSVVDNWCGPDQERLVAGMRLDHASYVAAIQWCASTPGGQGTGLRLLGLLRYHWLAGGLLAEGRMRLEALLGTAREPSPARFDCLWVVVWVALLQGDPDGADRWLDELARQADQGDDATLDRHLRHWRALRSMVTGDLDAAVRGFTSAADQHRATGDAWLALTARYMLASALVFSGHATEALEVASDTVKQCEKYGDRFARAYALWAGGVAFWTLGRYDEAEESARAVLQEQRTLRDGICVALTTELLAWVAYDRGKPDRAAVLSGAARHVWRSVGTSLQAFGPQLSAASDEHSPAPSAPVAAERNARLRDLDHVIDVGLGPSAPAVRQRGETEPLTKRELEVAALIQSGLSNRAIAQKLFVSKRTADGHVERILAKLGFSSRAQVAAWMARRTGNGPPG
jgi:predicted ATPase/DNA-binding CsgD family transcriptional regulator